MRNLFVVLSGIISLIAYVPYAVAMIRSKGAVRPNRAGWLVWWLVDATMLWALYSAYAYSAMPMFAGFTIGSSVILLLSLKNGDMQFSALDITCIAVAVIGIVVWRMFAVDNPEVSVVANVVAATMGAIPTFVKSVQHPESEDMLTWQIFAVGGLLSVIAVSKFTLVDAFPPIAVNLLQFGVIFSILIGRKRARM